MNTDLNQSNQSYQCPISVAHIEVERPIFAVYMKTIFARIFTEAEPKAK